MTKTIFITGAAGFIGFHLAKHLCAAGFNVTGFDNLNDYYDVSLKNARLAQLQKLDNFKFEKGDLADYVALDNIFTKTKPDIVINLAAQAGVRYSIDNPSAYVDSNLVGFANILEACRHHKPEHLIFASSSSVYGANTKIPFATSDNVDHPLSLYAATKKSNELMAHTYAHLYGLPCTGLRFFTVYGTWGRPDMAYYKFTDSITHGRPIDVYNNGKMKRDFTHISDIVASMERLLTMPPSANPNWDGDTPDPSSSKAPYKIYNIGNNKPENLMDMISILEDQLGRKAQMNMMPMQPGDVEQTFADVDDLEQATGFKPNKDLREGLAEFVQWYKKYNNIQNAA